jgi:hypothetical protein
MKSTQIIWWSVPAPRPWPSWIPSKITTVVLVMATALLAIRCFRTGNDLVAVGFLVFAIGEGVLLSCAAASPESSVRSLAAGITLWGTALLLVSIPGLFALPVRIIGVASAALFIITAARIFMGERLLPTDGNLVRVI